MTVGQLFARGGVALHVVRYCTRIGLLERRRHPDNRYNLFTSTDVRPLRFIRRAQCLGYSLVEIRHFFALRSMGRALCTEVRAIIGQRLTKSRERQHELIALQRHMRRALHLRGQFPGELGNTGDVCGLIEWAEGNEKSAWPVRDTQVRALFGRYGSASD